MKSILLTDTLDQMVGQPLRGFEDCGFMCFRFGPWMELDDGNGEFRTTTNISLLVECGWQISKGNQFLTLRDSDRDSDFDERLVELLRPVLGEPLPESFEAEPERLPPNLSGGEQPDRKPLRIEMTFDEHVRREDLVVVEAAVGRGGILSVTLSRGYVLTAMPKNPYADFHWAITIKSLGTNLYCCGPNCRLAPWCIFGSSLCRDVV